MKCKHPPQYRLVNLERGRYQFCYCGKCKQHYRHRIRQPIRRRAAL